MDKPGTSLKGGNSVWIVVTCFLVFICFSLSVMAEENSTVKEHSKALVLIYMVGSDLESGIGHDSGNDGTNDLLNMIGGYGNTTPEDLNIIVGYGGSKAPGWDGLTIATVDELKKDAADGVIGNEEIYDYNNPEVNMGNGTGLATFLSKVNDEYDGDKTYLIFWDHGDGFGGFGVDENSGDIIQLSDLNSVLNQSGKKYDLIGFDACLMAGIEVAKSLSPYADYLVASEEISSGGWTYKEWVADLAKDPEQDPAATGKLIVDTFFHRDEPTGNTAALINLSKIAPIIDSLDELGTAINDKSVSESSVIPIARAYEKTTRFGDAGTSDDQVALKLDLYTLVDYLAETVPDAKQQAEKVKSALKDAVIHENHDDLMSNATGISIADPLTVPDSEYNEIADVLSLSPEWDMFIKNVRNNIRKEIPSPDIVSVGTNTYILKTPDESADMSVAYFAVDNETGSILELGTLPVIPNDNGTYELPDWDGEWMYLQDPADPNQQALIDLMYGDTTGTGILKYISEVNLVRNGTMHKTIMYSYVDPDSNWTKYSFRPYNIGENGDMIFNRAGFTPGPGDSLVSYASAYAENGTDLGMSEIGEMDITGTPEIVSGVLPDGLYGWALLVNSVTGESDIGDMHLLTIKNGVVNQTEIAGKEEIVK
jgi:hypothetical protein